ARVGRILSKALAKSPSDRPEDAKTMVRTLEEAIRDHDKVPSSARLPVVPSETAPSSPAPSPLRKSPSADPRATEQPRAIGYATTDGQQGLVTSAGEGLGTKWRDTLLFLFVGVAVAGGGGILFVRTTRQTTQATRAVASGSQPDNTAANPAVPTAREAPSPQSTITAPTIAASSQVSSTPSTLEAPGASATLRLSAPTPPEPPATQSTKIEPKILAAPVPSAFRPVRKNPSKKLPGSGLD
ncbi:MAG: hypothetical protein KBF88_04895, partial [Polyangiaceae bacterium]|nr:hypothetical protein [Polyangiaceae bacterium]